MRFQAIIFNTFCPNFITNGIFGNNLCYRKEKRGVFLEDYKKLSQLKIGEKGLIESVNTSGPLCERMTDMGMVKGVLIECAAADPFGSMKAYKFHSSTVAIRKKDAEKIILKIPKKF